MKFQDIDQLEEYVGDFVSEQELKLLWLWVQNKMVTDEQIIQITKECRSDQECLTNSFRKNAWQTFFKNHTT